MKIELIQDEKRNETELWIDGSFEASWRKFEVPEECSIQLRSVFDHIFKAGETARSKEIRRLLSL